MTTRRKKSTGQKLPAYLLQNFPQHTGATAMKFLIDTTEIIFFIIIAALVLSYLSKYFVA
jgi:hypothetical protein